jgi:hypothetical protein
MALLSTPLEKAERRLADTRAELSAACSRLGSGLDYEDGLALREEIASLERKEAAAVDALTFAQRTAAEAAEADRKAKATAEVEAYRREAKREMPAHFTKIGKLVEQLAAELATVEVHNKRTAEINGLAREFGLEPVLDGETLFRATPRRVIPARYEERTVWKDGHGNEARVFGANRNGELVPTQGGYLKERERVLVEPERVEGGRLPGGRLSPAIRLVDLNGRQVWPVR